MNNSHSGQEPGEDFDVRTRHGQIWREYDEPVERYRAIPWWLKHLIYSPLFIWGIWYMLVYSGAFDSKEYFEGSYRLNYGAGEIAPEKEGSALPVTAASTGPDGAVIYKNTCSSCHQANGLGVPGAFPPLAGSDWVAGDEQILIALVLHGLMGEISVNGEIYNGVMPPWSATLKDDDIAAVLTYVRSELGNSFPAVSKETVTTIRNRFDGRAAWTEADLKDAFPSTTP